MEIKMNLNQDNLQVLLSNVSQAGITTIIEGAAGIGKTEMMKRIVKKLNIPTRFTSSYVIAEGDTQPIISPNVQTGKTNTDLSSLMKDIISLSEEVNEYKGQFSKGIYFLDELNLLLPTDMKAVLHWFNEGAIDIPFEDDSLDIDHDKVTNKKYDISNLVLVSAWNDPDKGFMAANEVDPSMVSRLAIVHAQLDKDDFKNFATDRFDSDVVAFIMTNLDKIDGANDDTQEGKVSPRMLEKLSDVMKLAKSPNGAFTTKNFVMLRVIVDSLLKSSSLTNIFMKSLEDKSRISLDELLNKSVSSIKDTTKNLPSNEQIRLIIEMLQSNKDLIKKYDEKWVAFVDNLDSEAAFNYTFQLKRISDLPSYKQKFPNVYSIIADDTKSYDKYIELFAKICNTKNNLKNATMTA